MSGRTHKRAKTGNHQTVKNNSNGNNSNGNNSNGNNSHGNTLTHKRPSGRFDALVDMGNPLKGITVLPYLERREEGRALAALGPAAALELSRTAQEIGTAYKWGADPPIFVVPIFVVGHYDTVILDYRLATTGDWTNPQFQKDLVNAHQRDHGWPILDELPFSVNSPLCVKDATAKVYHSKINHRNFYTNNEIKTDGYSALFLDLDDPTKAVWITNPPKPDSNVENPNWTCEKRRMNSSDVCLYVHKSYKTPAAPAADAAAPGGGSRRSRKHKRRNYVKKQKKRTRKH